MTSPARSTAEIIPVLDLMRGQVVRGIAGQRDSYQPITSRLADSADPLEIADAFADQRGLDRIYLADLDAIENNQPAWNEIERLARAGHRLMVDAGLRDVDRARDLVERGVETVVAGLETISGPELVRELVQAVGDEKLVFSLDLKQGVPMANPDAWPESTPDGIADSVIDAGVVRLIVLDLAGAPKGQKAQNLRDLMLGELQTADIRGAKVLAPSALGLMELSLKRTVRPLLEFDPMQCGPQRRKLEIFAEFLRAFERAAVNHRTSTCKATISMEMKHILDGQTFDWMAELSRKYGSRFDLDIEVSQTNPFEIRAVE